MNEPPVSQPSKSPERTGSRAGSATSASSEPPPLPRGEGRTKGFWVCERCGPC